jgi:hypothetical protein
VTRRHGKIGRVNSLPLVGAEVQRIDTAFSAVSRELGGVLTSLREVDLTRVGTPSADAAVGTGMTDLEQALGRLQATADACTTALRRHGVEDEQPPAEQGDPA